MRTHLVLTEKEFEELKTIKMVPLDDLPISNEEKEKLKALAHEKFGGIEPLRDPIPRVVCGFVDDAVVCRVLPRD
jgi:hypothetical protein